MHKQVVFFGSSPLSNIVLEKVLSAKCEVLSVVTKADKPVGRGQKLAPNPVKVLAQKNDIEVMTTYDHHVTGAIGLVAAYGSIIKQEVLDTFSNQIYNIHPSLLPKYRGASPLQTQILDGVSETGVTIIQLDAEMDHGPIVEQKKSVLKKDETWISLGERLFAEGTEMFLALSTEHLALREQDHNLATYTKKITRQDGFIPYEQFVYELRAKSYELEKKLRAFFQWPGVWTIMPDGKRLKLIALKPNVLVQIEGKSPQPWPI